jgi:hypothetical protein
MAQIVVEVGKQMDGATFQLSPQTRATLASKTGRSFPASSIFVSYETPKKADGVQGPLWGHIVALLTGLSEDQIHKMGGFSVVSPTDDEILFESGTD